MAATISNKRLSILGPTSPIPNKLYFKIGEVSRLVGVETHVLRYWEKEISMIRPGKTQSNQRRYRFKDVELFREIRRLLYEERYTLAGAKHRLFERGKLNKLEESVLDELDPIQLDPSQTIEPISVNQNVSELPPDVVPFSGQPTNMVNFNRVKTGLRDLIRLAGEDI